MEILCACDESYLPHTAAMLCSLLEHNALVRVHLFHGSIAGRTLDKLTEFIKRYGGTITYYEMMPGDFDACQVDGWASTANYYRLAAPKFISEDVSKILYLDSDLLVRRSLETLWNTDVAGHPLAAVRDLGAKFHAEDLGLSIGTKYFNSGVMLMNLCFWRQHCVYEKLMAVIQDNHGALNYWDQDALNLALANCWIELPEYWNSNQELLIGTEHRILSLKTPGPKLGQDPAIVHFCGAVKPWHWSQENPFKHEYRVYRGKTPWPRYKLERTPTLAQRLRGSLRSLVRTVVPGKLRRMTSFRAGAFSNRDRVG
jgi:lipopolysaccharide biosynthesis glycosyltransferase